MDKKSFFLWAINALFSFPHSETEKFAPGVDALKLWNRIRVGDDQAKSTENKADKDDPLYEFFSNPENQANLEYVKHILVSLKSADDVKDLFRLLDNNEKVVDIVRPNRDWDELLKIIVVADTIFEKLPIKTLVYLFTFISLFLSNLPVYRQMLTEIITNSGSNSMTDIEFEQLGTPLFHDQVEMWIRSAAEYLRFSTLEKPDSHILDLNLEKVNILWKTLCLLLILREISSITQKINNDQHDLIFTNALKLPFFVSLGFVSTNLLADKTTQIIISKYVSGKLSREGRWAKFDHYKDLACKRAEERWKSGETKLHDEMADDIYLELREEFPKVFRRHQDEITRNSILRAIKPIAKKYNKVRGEKDARKN